VIRAYLFALDPTDAQVQKFRSHCGAQRLAYNWCLARHITGASWAELRRQLTYKAERAGVRMVVAHRWFASSKGTGVRPVVLARSAVRLPREESLGTQRHHREAVAR
jgi:hypothetical protein